MKAARVFQLTVLLLVLTSVVMVGWWVLDQHLYTNEKVEQERAMYQRQVNAAQALLGTGMSDAAVQTLLPDIVIVNDSATLHPGRLKTLDEEQQRRLYQYLWEGGFFLLALFACIAVIWRALRAEALVLKEQDSFLALVSHQFKTPLASLQLSLETMTLRTLPPERMRTLIDRMLSDLARMEAMVSQILDSARLERGQIDLKCEPVRLASVVGRVVSQYDERVHDGRITIHSQVAEDLEILADPLSVDVVIRNVLENAVAAVTPVGGGSITLAARRHGNDIELTVRDSGVGFRPADANRLFDKFSRLHPGGGSSYSGTGLGLFIVKRLMHRIGGRVSATSPGLGQGAEFSLVWPVAVTPS